ncbi:MAG: carboxylating nicotinate-nucleotide diphosphorylase [Acidimicrobiia bacterium]|nr:carboxylating nicotinate-nucleotide diphosphorylase [Acidimicrobiia bacterium]
MRPEHLEPPSNDVRAAVERALAEDLTPLGDLSAALISPTVRTTARFVSRADGVLAGVACAGETFSQVDPAVRVEWSSADGDHIVPGQALATVEGRLTSVLVAERTALNFLGHLSGIATRVAEFVTAADGGVRIWDTRKTTPGLRSLEKAAVRAGGGYNHRGNLSDWVMLKDNHLTGTTIAAAVAAARARWPARTVQVECDRLDQLVEAIGAGADLVLLDNMTPDEVRGCVVTADELAAGGSRRPLLEASGGITIETVADYAATGVDLLSSGALTNSAPVLDIGLDIAASGSAQ